MEQEFVTLPREVVEQMIENMKSIVGDSGYDRMLTRESEQILRAALDQPQGEQEPLFWYRPRSDVLYEGPLHKSQIERVRKESGGWEPLYTNPQNLNCKSTQARLATLWGYVKEQHKTEPQFDAISA